MHFIKFILLTGNLFLFTNLSAENFDSLSVEQIMKTYSIITELEQNLYDSEILLNFYNGNTSSHELSSLKSILENLKKTNLELIKDDKILEVSIKNLKTKKIENPKINFFSKINGKRFASFQCKSLKIGKMRLGIFEIPSNKIIIDSPEITFY